ncbi:MAG: glutamate--tRNA ligase [Candidatus Jorgensenbacteria bacterium]|nr:glutamate--tRNA ligase [Candidatus Jorgensenbacteria bacterium]
MGVRVRFAPSPTGFFSLGNARTALFNWLFARHEGGEFLLRIEDTDKERSTKEFEEDVIAGLRWIGLDWDGSITRQSERLDLYEKYLRQLVAERKAYHCFCTEEELEAEYQGFLSQGLIPKYSGKCSHLKEEEVQTKLKSGLPSVIRIVMPSKTAVFNDIIRGKIEFKTELFGDIIIAKGFRSPLYNFAAVVDDFEMQVTDVIRGEDHLSNTPKQMIIQEALGFPSVHYAHLPLILGPDRKKLSKRYAAASINDFRREGYIPEAMVNFLALLGWHPERDREVLSRAEIVSEFSLKRVQKASAVYNEEKLNWLNANYLKNMDANKFIEVLKPFVPGEWLLEKDLLHRALPLVRERITKLSEFSGLADYFFSVPEYAKELLIWKEGTLERTTESLREIAESLEKISARQFNKEAVQSALDPLTLKFGRGEVYWPLRAALSGRVASPGPLELTEAFGKTETLSRIMLALEKIKSSESMV